VCVCVCGYVCVGGMCKVVREGVELGGLRAE
jgi:hypothetical protein